MMGFMCPGHLSSVSHVDNGPRGVKHLQDGTSTNGQQLDGGGESLIKRP